MKREKEKEKDSKTARVEQQQIFTSNAATGVLTNDLLKIMDESDKLVCNINIIHIKQIKLHPTSEVWIRYENIFLIIFVINLGILSRANR